MWPVSAPWTSTAEWIARQITEAFPWDSAPTLIRDRDAAYGFAVTRRLAAMGIGDHPIAPRSPWQHGHAERLIGSIGRECLDHVIIFGEAPARIYPWLRMHRSFVRYSGLVTSTRGRSSAAFIMNCRT
jgi:hypothetical protein